MVKKKNGFTLIELIAVLVILAIIALIVTPLMFNVVKKARIAANKRSIDGYGKATELAIANYLAQNRDYPTSLNGLDVEYTGNEVICNVKILKEDGSIYLTECSVEGAEVKDASTDDGYYHYGVEPTTYKSYQKGDLVKYNGIDFYVIENSDETSYSVTLLKAEPLTVDEVNVYGKGHINMYMDSNSTSYQTAYDMNGYGGIAYYTSPTCGYDGTSLNEIGCTTNYDQSEIKYVVDSWSKYTLNAKDLVEDSLGYKTRLITYSELITNLGYDANDIEPTSGGMRVNDDVPKWLYDNDYRYWTMSKYNDSTANVWVIDNSGWVHNQLVGYHYHNYLDTVRPVITLRKFAITE